MKTIVEKIRVEIIRRSNAFEGETSDTRHLADIVGMTVRNTQKIEKYLSYLEQYLAELPASPVETILTRIGNKWKVLTAQLRDMEA